MAKRLALKLLAVSVGCVIAAVVAEGAMRLWNPFETRLRGDRIVLPASKTYIFADHGLSGVDPTITHTKNSLGFRGPELPSGGLNRHLSVVTVGGSTTECLFLSDDKSWPGVLQELLEEDLGSVWLNNAGLEGHSTFGHEILMNEYVVRIRPTIVVFLIGLNDVGTTGPTDHALSQVKGGIRFGSPRRFLRSLAAYSDAVAVAFEVYRYSRARMKGLPHRNIDFRAVPQLTYPEPRLQTEIERHQAEYLPGYRRRVTELLAISRRNGIIPVLVTQPVLFGGATDPTTGVDLGGVGVSGQAGHTKWTVLELYNDVTRRIGEEHDVLVIDLAAELPKDSRYFYDFYHFTNDGARAVATVIHRHLAGYVDANHLDAGSSQIANTARGAAPGGDRHSGNAPVDRPPSHLQVASE